ncbi:Tex family protein [Avrilella dinanensis]|uniref:RNA-binding transcriptional accessory protein n=1 Tax=Avrilella dinanensis TaxID=2008672 RepID=A0A2M9R364_9FLAO|nr:Tex family protein [Avrilella dinanensis]PJR03292.1 RNA-binding transcriptional accessory protein [Avrilella dinanensis]
MDVTQYIQKQLQLPEKSINNTLQLLNEDCTIPFIARYRKDFTGNLDEVAIEKIARANELYLQIQKRKESILSSIDEQNALTDDLKSKIEQSYDLTEIEDLYLPYKKKRKTRADKARENGLEPLAKIIMAQNTADINQSAERFVNENIFSTEDALQGARDIIAEWINENAYFRQVLRKKFRQEAVFTAKVIATKKEESDAQKYAQYFDWQEPLRKMPAHRLLAALRAHQEGFVRITTQIETDDAIDWLCEKQIKQYHTETAEQIRQATSDAYKRLLAPSLENEVLAEAKERADRQSIEVFSTNLSQLLLAAPLGEKRVLAIDPGFKTGCKVVCLDENGQLLYNETIFPHPPQRESSQAMKKIRSMVNAYKTEAIAIGNGTASRETESFVKKIAFDRDVQVFIVNEAGASVYSASKIAREEFPNYDVTVRGAVSIGRRLQDPLAELVKIDPKSIGVGQYQHDVDQKMLQQALDNVVVHAVNSVGVNLNTASKSLLSYVSGIGEKLAENIVEYRKENGTFDSRKTLKDVPRLGEKAFQQAAAFVRVRGGVQPLDNSAVHPEAYSVVEKMAKSLKISVDEFIGNKTHIESIRLSDFVSETMGELYLQDVLQELQKPGLDPRKSAKILEFDPNIKTIHDVTEGQTLPGIVNNITHFGCFVDIGIKESGLVHISQLKAGFVSDVHEVVKLHQHVQVKVLSVDKATKRIQLSMVL